MVTVIQAINISSHQACTGGQSRLRSDPDRQKFPNTRTFWLKQRLLAATLPSIPMRVIQNLTINDRRPIMRLSQQHACQPDELVGNAYDSGLVHTVPGVAVKTP